LMLGKIKLFILYTLFLISFANIHDCFCLQ